MATTNQQKKHPYAVSLGRRGGLRGGVARAARMTAKERSASARHAVNVRWARYRGEKPEEPSIASSSCACRVARGYRPFLDYVEHCKLHRKAKQMHEALLQIQREWHKETPKHEVAGCPGCMARKGLR